MNTTLSFQKFSRFWLLLIFICIGSKIIAQGGVKDEPGRIYRIPTPLHQIREADVLWSTRLWRELYLRQGLNYPLYYPLDSVYQGTDSFYQGKISLTQIIYNTYLVNPDNFGPNGIKLYKSSELKEAYNSQEIHKIINKIDTVKVLNEQCVLVDSVVEKQFNEIKPELVKIRLMEDWFYDRGQAKYDVRILAIALVFPDYQIATKMNFKCGKTAFSNYEKMEDSFTEIWLFYPQIRPLLASYLCYKEANDSILYSYDDVFIKRIFSSYIYKKENVYGNNVSEFSAGLDALLETNRIRNRIIEEERNLWQY